MKQLVALVLVLALCGPVQAQTTPPISTASVILSVIRIALNLGSGKQDYVQVDVVSTSATFEQARHQGFRTAIEQSIGTVVASQSQSQQQRLIQNEIITYSSGYVDKFEILDQQSDASGVRLKMRVWVAESRLAHRLLGRSIDNQAVDGNQLGAQIATLIQERQSGDQLISTVMRDFPERSFVVEAKTSKVKFDEYRRAILEVPVELRWDENWVTALIEAVHRTQDPAKSWLVYNTVNQVNPMIKLSLVDASGLELFKQCQGWVMTRSQVSYHYPNRFMLDVQRDQLLIDKRYYLNGTIGINLGQNTQLIEQINQIKVEIVPASKC